MHTHTKQGSLQIPFLFQCCALGHQVTLFLGRGEGVMDLYRGWVNKVCVCISGGL